MRALSASAAAINRMDRFARVVGLAVGASALLTFGIGLWMGESASHMFTVAVALAVASIPEGLIGSATSSWLPPRSSRRWNCTSWCGALAGPRTGA